MGADVGHDVAILDVNLGKEYSFPIADHLIREGTPIAFLTGYDAASVLPERFRGIPCLSKPFSDDGLLQRITSLANSRLGQQSYFMIIEMQAEGSRGQR